MRKHMLGDRGSRIFHQRKRGHAEALTGGAVNGAHFCRGNNFHFAIPE